MPSVLLFLGLPLDVRESDLAELLTSDPTRLLPSSIAVTALHNSAGTFLGTFLVEVGNDVDAEKVRRHYSGQVIDGSHLLAVHHVLPSNTPHPTASVPTQRAPLPTKQPAKAAQPAKPKQPKVDNSKPPGLKLLGRMNKAGKAGEKEKQKILLEKQRAALKKGKANPGDLLLSRLGKNKPAAKKVVTGVAKKAGGKDKVARAKRDSGRMEVDKAPAAAPANKPKSQSQLDEEMKAYERQRRFAA